MQKTATGTALQVEPGSPWPLGAFLRADGAHFAVFASTATRVELCLFEPVSGARIGNVDLPACTDGVWHGSLRGLKVPVAYGYRVHGESTPGSGNRFNPSKLLLDPYARAIDGRFDWTESHLEGRHAGLDNEPAMVRGLLRADPVFDWGDDSSPGHPMAETLIYEAHVKGFTARHPDLPPPLRGTYAGIAHPAVIAHLKRLGVTAVELLPVQYAIDEQGLAQRGRINYWGYNTLGFFAPNPRYAIDDADLEFRTMVKGLHAAGLEVILDVVYNHTAEGDERGPTLSWRGIDNAAYYQLRGGDRDRYENHSGCGNTLNLAHPRVLQMVLDSLRHWVTHYRVDGFRFDLASALARTTHGFDPHAVFFHAIAQDPVLQRVKLIAEPWDTGPGGYRVGGFPAGWTEWNDRFRDDCRAFWLQKAGDRATLARRFTGSADLFNVRDGFGVQRAATASLNYIAAHDGFTLEDVVSWSRKHNDANGEGNRDGSGSELSWNCGAEGPTKLRAVLARRRWLKRAMLATLFLARGVPMLLGGDEMGRTQDGNNNAYCQDNETSWFDWNRVDEDQVDYVAGLMALRKRLPMLTEVRWLTGEPTAGRRRDVVWTDRDGSEMATGVWNEQSRYMLGMQVAAGDERRGRVLILFNAELESCPFALPPGRWTPLLDSAARDPFSPASEGDPVISGHWPMQGCSLVVLEQTRADDRNTDDEAR